MRTGNRSSQNLILEELHVNEAKAHGNYFEISDIKTLSKVKDFFAHRVLIDYFYDFMMKWNESNKEYYKKNFSNLEYKDLRFSVGKNYIKIVSEHSVSAFVDRFGNVYKAASWEAPAKGVRYYLDFYNQINFDAYGGFLYGNKNLPPRTEESYH